MPDTLSLRAPDGREFPVTAALRIGRAPENEIVLADDRVSRLHARLWSDGDRLFIRDEGSSNGTYVNDLALASGDSYRLRPGDVVRVGAATYTVVMGQPARAVTGPLPTAQPPTAQPLVSQIPLPQSPPAQPSVIPPPAAPVPLLAATRIDSAVPTPTANHRSRLLLLGGCLVLLLLAVCGGLVLFGATAGRPLLATAMAHVGGAPTHAPAGTSTAPPGPGTAISLTPGATGGAITVQVLPAVPTPAPWLPQSYATNSQALAAALADLNTAQLRFIHDAAAGALPGPASTDDLLNLAATAFKLASGAESLCRASAVQAGGSAAAAQVAGLYAGLARYGYAQALDAQNLRQALAGGALKLPDAIARVADFGARAWNPSVTDPAQAGNPFLPFVSASAAIPPSAPLSVAGAAALQASLGAQASLQSWIAAPAQTITHTVAFPSPTRRGSLGDPQDPALLAGLLTPAGQADAARASQAAVAGLQRLGATLAPSAGSQRPAKGAELTALAGTLAGAQALSYQAPAALVMAADAKPGGQALPSFPSGAGAALAKGAPAAAGGDDAFINNVFSLGPDNTPARTGDTPITTAAPLVSLTIGNIRVGAVNKNTPGSGTFEANVQYSFDVTWQTGLVNPQFQLSCSSGNNQEVSAAGGTSHIQANGLLILYPGVETAYCYANRSGNTIGSVSTSFLVGDSAGATQRAIQVETDSAALDLTLTADAQGTQAEATRQAAHTQSVLQTQSALETEQAATQTAEFRATITQIAHLTALAAPVASDTPSPTPTFVPVLLETLVHPGDQFAVSTKTVLQPNRLYQFCFSGTVNLINPDRAAKASDIDHVNGVAVPISGCMVVEGNGQPAVISCGSGEVAQDPGGFTIQVVDLGPA